VRFMISFLVEPVKRAITSLRLKCQAITFCLWISLPPWRLECRTFYCCRAILFYVIMQDISFWDYAPLVEKSLPPQQYNSWIKPYLRARMDHWCLLRQTVYPENCPGTIFTRNQPAAGLAYSRSRHLISFLNRTCGKSRGSPPRKTAAPVLE